MINNDRSDLPPLDSSRFPPELAFGMDFLLKRPSRTKDFEAENRALVILADELANRPRNLLQKLAEIALELCHAGSAGISILESDGKAFRWHACAGSFAENAGARIPYAESPCGIVLEQNSPILFLEPGSYFTPLKSMDPLIMEALILPFHDGNKPVGTVWVMQHSIERKFDREDVRLMTSLSRFASAAYHIMCSINKSMDARDLLEKRVDERTMALSHVNKTLRRQIRERGQIEEALRNAQNQLEAEISSLNCLHELSSRLVDTSDLPAALREILGAAVVLLGADMGVVQLYDPVNKLLTIAAHHGFEQDFLDQFKTVDADGDAACSRALASRQRWMIEDVRADERYAGYRAAADKAGYRAVQSTPLFSRDGQPLGMLTTHFRLPRTPAEHELSMLDLYARQASDFIERLRITEQLQEADRRKDEFIATLSHELRNPLAAIDSSAMLMESPNLGSREREKAIRIVQRQCRAMKVLLDDLLDISRLSLGRMTLHKQCVTLASIIDAAVEVMRPHIDTAHHILSVTKPPSSVVVYGDPMRLTQVFTNLLANSAKYTNPGGRITLDVNTAAEGIVVSVTDNGIGIDPLFTEEIFGMFSQRKSTSDRTTAGLGIGLALVRAIVALHGGWARAESRGLGQGSTFRVGLPLAKPTEIAAQISPSGMTQPAPDSGAHAFKAKYRILVADDNTSAATAISMLLQRGGHETTAVHDGRAALETAARFLPDIALLDIGMPYLNGYEVARQIRSAPWGANMRLFAATGWGQEKDKKLAREAGFDVHMTKPIDFKQLLALIEEHGRKE
ncbi:signal transduction histidine kinase [Nitrosospira sp. Nsp5]|uniref:histidine kinase n=1 Tax=Nitrosospira multiformis TaxID=1231 RepID=A0ABY0TFG3_9PROT|nr:MULTISPECIES: GAF domain-containing protein [Nitrosospira]PTR10792.1 signal transduction histidine kinase [Nitrosospira sp. Nsp5]SDQ74893.1 Signal transduction histidine kinase [Nitrosospira multiformis]